MSIDKKEVRHIAKLSRLAMSEQEIDTYSVQLSNIIQYVEKLNELDTTGVEPTSHIIEMKNILREDSNWECLSPDEILSNAPDRKDNFYRVPKIIE